MAERTNQDLVEATARQVIAEVASKELPLFRPLSQAYFKNPEKTLRGGAGKDQMLGFGAVEAATMLMTPVVLHSAQLTVSAVVTTLGGGLLTQFSRQFMTTLSTELVKDEEQAGRLADSIVAKLATGRT